MRMMDVNVRDLRVMADVLEIFNKWHEKGVRVGERPALHINGQSVKFFDTGYEYVWRIE